MNILATKNSFTRFAKSAALLLLLAFGNQCIADIRLPNGEYREQVEDLRVKVPGGHVSVLRTWQADNVNKGEYRWFVNPAWADLRFEYDSIDGTVKSIARADSLFERSGDDTFVYEKIYFIARLASQSGATTGWRWYDRRGNWITYAADGKINGYGDRNDVTLSFVRSGPDGAISAVKDHNGVVALQFEYEPASANLSLIRDRAGREVRYGYTGGRLTAVTDVESKQWSYGYSGDLLTTISGPRNRVTTIVYSGNRVVKIVDPKNFERTWEYAYDRGKRQYTIVERTPENRRVERRYDAAGRMILELRGSRQVYSFKRSGESVHITTDERGMTTRTEYDANRNPVKVIHADGSFTTAKFNSRFGVPIERVDEIGVKTAYEYDGHGNLTRLVEAAGTQLERVTTYTYDDLGQQETRTLAESGGEATTVGWSYDTFGNIQTATDAEQRATSFEYDANGLEIARTDALDKRWVTARNKKGWITGTEDPSGVGMDYEYDEYGNRTKIIDGLGKETSFVYDANNRLTSLTDSTNGTVAYTYDKDGLRLTQLDAANVQTTFVYDTDGRLSSTTDAAGNVIEYEYGVTSSDAGLLVRKKLPTYCEEYRYDQRARRTQVANVSPCEGTTPQRREVRSIGIDAKGRIVSETDGRANITLRVYDVLDRVVEETDALGGRETFGYDARDNPVSVGDAAGQVRRFAYDKTNRLLRETSPLGAAIAYAYDLQGNLTLRKLEGGERSVYTNDAAGRRTEERHYPAGSNVASQTVAFSHDDRGLLHAYTQSGAVASSAVYAYDDAGRRTSETVTFGNGSQAFSRSLTTQYQPDGRKKRIVYPDGISIEFAYDRGRLASASSAAVGEISWDDYAWQVPQQVEYPGAVRTLVADSMQRYERTKSQAIGAGTSQSPTGGVIMDETNAFDASGNLESRTASGGDYAYTHDSLNRLKQVVAPSGVTADAYTYDRAGNRTSSNAQPGEWTYDADNRLLRYGTGQQKHQFTYDANGNPVKETIGDGQPPETTIDRVYDALGRLSEVRRNGVLVGRYQYDPFGRRIRKETQAGAIWFLYSDEGLMAEYSATGSPTRSFGWEPDSYWGTRPLWLADRISGSWRPSYFHNNYIGAPQRLTDSTGGVVWSASMRPFGETTVAPESTVPNPLRLPGQYFDDETETNYNYFRTYVPEQGRYAETDPLGVDGGLNLYSYVGQRPLAMIDPLGLEGFGYWSMPPGPERDKLMPRPRCPDLPWEPSDPEKVRCFICEYWGDSGRLTNARENGLKLSLSARDAEHYLVSCENARNYGKLSSYINTILWEGVVKFPRRLPIGCDIWPSSPMGGIGYGLAGASCEPVDCTGCCK